MNSRMLILAALIAAPVGAQIEEAPVPPINTQIRQDVVTAYRQYFLASDGMTPQWTGSVSPVNPGTITLEYRQAMLRRINWYRRMVGLSGDVVLDPALNRKCQAGALMIHAANQYTPYTTPIPTSWPAYTPEGAEGCQNSNLALARPGIQAVDAFIFDGVLPDVAHRLYFLTPGLATTGLGYVPATGNPVPTHAMIQWASAPLAPTAAAFVAWPPAGYFPLGTDAEQKIPTYWSVTYGSLNFSNSTVSVTKNGAALTVNLQPTTVLVNANGRTWSLPGDTAQAGDVYQVTIGNVLDQGFPRNFSYTVKPIDPEAGKLINVSTRLRVETGDNVGIAGFVVSGDGSRRVVIRAMGPSLTGFGVAGALSNPTLEVRDATGRLIASNDDWQTGPQLGEAGSTDGRGVVREVINVGDTPFAPSNPREAAIALSLMPGQYTAIVRGVAGENGIALAEVFDLDAADINSRAVNVSTRGKVGQGDAVMIGGFVVRGTTSTVPVVVRAMGPSLTALGVQGALQDPTLELRDSTGQVVATCDDVRAGDQPALGALFPTDSREAAVRVDLAPGSYTAIVRGKNGMTGVALVEAYEVK